MSTPLKLYRYFKPEHFEDLRNGFIYINTFYEIRKLDNEKLIGDPHEALAINKVTNISIRGEDKDKEKPKQQLQAIRSNLGIAIELEPGANFGIFHIQNSSGINSLPDAYMLCFACNRNDEYWENTSDKSLCIEVLDRKELIHRVAGGFRAQGILIEQVVHGGQCFYEDNIGSIDDLSMKDPHYFRKTPKHQSQDEYRLVFIPDKTQKITPIKVHIKIDDIINFL